MIVARASSVHLSCCGLWEFVGSRKRAGGSGVGVGARHVLVPGGRPLLADVARPWVLQHGATSWRGCTCDPPGHPGGGAALCLRLLGLTFSRSPGTAHPAGSWGLALSVTGGPLSRESLGLDGRVSLSLESVLLWFLLTLPAAPPHTCPHQGAGNGRMGATWPPPPSTEATDGSRWGRHWVRVPCTELWVHGARLCAVWGARLGPERPL